MKRMKYELYTENINYDTTMVIVSSYFPAFSVVNQAGYWMRKKEDSLLITIIGDLSDRPTILEMAIEIKKENKQQAVLVAACQIDEIMV